MTALFMALVVLNCVSGVLWALGGNPALSGLYFTLAILWVAIGVGTR